MSFVNTAKLRADNKRLMNEIKAAVRASAETAAETAMLRLHALRPFKPGPKNNLLKKTKYSIKRTAGGLTVTFKASTHYASYLEVGTKPHPITPMSGQFLKFYWFKGGGIVFLRSVNHPGTKATHFLETTRNWAVTYFTDDLRRRLANK